MKLERRKELLLRLIIVLAIVSGLVFLAFPSGYKVTINGQEVGVIESRDLIEDSKAVAIAQMGQIYDTNARLLGDIEVKRAKMFRSNKITENYLVTYIRNNMQFEFEFLELYIDDEYVGIIANSNTLDTLLERLTSRYYGNYNGEVDFVNDITLKPIYTTKDALIPFEELVSLATTTTIENTVYTVEDSDTLLGIAIKLGTTYTRLLNANPTIDEDTIIRDGDTINAILEIPYVQIYQVNSTDND